jgi:hypothetical protein
MRRDTAISLIHTRQKGTYKATKVDNGDDDDMICFEPSRDIHHSVIGIVSVATVRIVVCVTLLWVVATREVTNAFGYRIFSPLLVEKSAIHKFRLFIKICLNISTNRLKLIVVSSAALTCRSLSRVGCMTQKAGSFGEEDSNWSPTKIFDPSPSQVKSSQAV